MLQESRKFCIVNREFPDLQYLRSTLQNNNFTKTVTIKTLGQNSNEKFTNFLKVFKLLGTN